MTNTPEGQKRAAETRRRLYGRGRDRANGPERYGEEPGAMAPEDLVSLEEVEYALGLRPASKYKRRQYRENGLGKIDEPKERKPKAPGQRKRRRPVDDAGW